MPRRREVVRLALLVAALTLVIAGQLVMGASARSPQVDAASIERGRAIFQKGRTSTGPLVGFLGADRIPLEGDLVSCALCHGERAKGTRGGEQAPPIHARALFAPTPGGQADRVARPAYDKAAVQRALREGLDPEGRALSWIMPRFELSETQLRDLLAYLAVVEEERGPGIHADRIRIGTSLPADARWAQASEDVRAVLKAAFSELNAQGGIFGRRLELHETELEKAFAHVSSIQPAGSRAPPEELPSIAPIGKEASSAGDRHFVLLPTTGDQARWAIQQLPESEKIAVIHSPDAFGSSWAEAALNECIRRARPRPLVLEAGGMDAEQLVREGITVVMLATPARVASRILEVLPPGVRVIAPGLLAHSGLAGSRDVRFIYPAQIVGGEGIPPALKAFLARHQLAPRNLPFQLNAFVAAQVLAEGLRRAGSNPTRADLVAALESLQDFETGATPPLTYGRDRRVGVQGARWVRLEPSSGALVFDSDWVGLAP